MEHNIPSSHIITLQFDDRLNIQYRNPDELCNFIHSKITDSQKYYILLDEVQLVSNFEEVLISFLHIKNVDIYIYMLLEAMQSFFRLILLLNLEEEVIKFICRLYHLKNFLMHVN